MNRNIFLVLELARVSNRVEGNEPGCSGTGKQGRDGDDQIYWKEQDSIEGTIFDIFPEFFKSTHRWVGK